MIIHEYPCTFLELDSDLPPGLATEKVSVDGDPKASVLKHQTIKEMSQTMINKQSPRYITSACVTTVTKIKGLLNLNARVAQMVEQGFCKPQVVGSNPISSSRQDGI